MVRLHEGLREKTWGLGKARSLASDVIVSKSALRALLQELFRDDVEVRKRAADVMRRISECEAALLVPYADEIAGLLEDLPPDESRTRWHLGLVVPRVAHTRLQRMRAVRIMHLLAEDESNLVRCSAVEGLGALALADASLRDEAEEMASRFLRDGTLAMKSRSRHVLKMLKRAYGER